MMLGLSHSAPGDRNMVRKRTVSSPLTACFVKSTLFVIYRTRIFANLSERLEPLGAIFVLAGGRRLLRCTREGQSL